MLLFMRSLQILLNTFSLSPNDLHLLLNMFLKNKTKNRTVLVVNNKNVCVNYVKSRGDGYAHAHNSSRE